MSLLLASNNAHKLAELQRMLGDTTPVVAPLAIGIELDVEETGVSFEENAILKARAFAAATGLTTVADDSGLVIDALQGRPGVYSARYGGPGLSDRDRIDKVLAEMRDVPDAGRSARFVSTIAVVTPDGGIRTFTGSVEGVITRVPIGTNGFGYDPIFFVPCAGKTFAEMSDEEKDAVSHRGRALREAVPYITGLDRDGILR